MNTLEITNKIMRENKLFAKKSFGQNFLIDDNVLRQIVEQSKVNKNDLVIEIGPGLGNLTEYILETGCKLIAFEIDDDMIEILNNRFKENENISIIKKDILKVDLNTYIKDIKYSGQVKVIANLPYYITTPIIYNLLGYGAIIDSITIMIQKEVADRLVAKEGTKDYGILSITTNYVADIKKLFDVSNTSFIPSPKVTSSVVKISINEEKKAGYKIKDEKMFLDLVKSSFSARRKKITNSILNANKIDISKEKIEKILTDNSINLNSRAEELSIEQFVTISNSI